MVCLDYSFIIDLFRGDKAAGNKLMDLMMAKETLVTTVIIIAELYKGAFGHARSSEKLQEIDTITNILHIFDTNIRAARIYGYYYQYLKSQGKMIDDRDILIIATMMAYGEHRIVTKNRKHFESIADIEVIDY
jgi:predicted nucleic acid-binding protein